MRSLADISGAGDDSDDGQNEYYAGGEKSGQASPPDLHLLPLHTCTSWTGQILLDCPSGSLCISSAYVTVGQNSAQKGTGALTSPVGRRPGLL